MTGHVDAASTSGGPITATRRARPARGRDLGRADPALRRSTVAVRGANVGRRGHGRASRRRAAGELRTSGGSIEVELPPGTGAELDARTSGGRIELDRTLTFTGERELEPACEGKLGPGGQRLELQTSGGNIEIRMR